MKPIRRRDVLGAALAVCAFAAVQSTAAAAWEPTKPVQFIVPAGTGGGADQMARFIQGVATKHKLLKEPIIVVNESGGAGAQGFLDVKGAKGDPNTIIITLSNLFTTPMATGVPFSWHDLTPVAMLALDEFVLWVNADTPYKTAMDYINAVKAKPNTFKMGGTGSKQEDQIITAEIEQSDRRQVHLHPVQGRRRRRGAARRQAHRLDGQQSDRGGCAVARRPVAAAVRVRFSSACRTRRRSRKDMSWYDIPTCKDSGLPVEYLMLRGIFMPAGVTQDQVDFYIDLFKKMRETPDWKAFTEQAAFNQSFMTGAEYVKWLEQAEAQHKTLMEKAGFMAKK